MAADHWMRFNIGDYLADTMHLTTLQHGIYILLIMHYFKRGELPSDAASLARISKVAMPQWKRASGPVIQLFRVENGYMRHRRIDSERAAAFKRKDGEEQGINGATHATGTRARPEPEPSKNSPLYPPVNGGKRGRADRNGWGKKAARNGFIATVSDDMQETIDVDTNDPRQRCATVVPISRRAIGG